MFSNKPMSRLDRDIDYLLPQDISDFAKDLGHDGGDSLNRVPLMVFGLHRVKSA